MSIELKKRFEAINKQKYVPRQVTSAGLGVVRNTLSGIRPTVRLGNTPGVKISDQLLNSTRGLRVEFNTRASDD